MKSKSILYSAALLFGCLTYAAAAEPIRIAGYFKEDGTYIQERLFDPIIEPANPPFLPDELKNRKKTIKYFYEGQVLTSKISFPACRSGLVLDVDRVGGINVDAFGKVAKHGVSIAKGEKAVITKFKIKSNYILIELNNGGYGTTLDWSKRILKDILTMGLIELSEPGKERYQRGSRLKIKCPEKLTKDNLDVDTVDEYLSMVFES